MNKDLFFNALSTFFNNFLCIIIENQVL